MEFRWYLFVVAIFVTVSSVNAGKCVVCDNCLTNLPTDTTTQCTADECFTLVDANGNVKRGCVKSDGEKCEGANCRKCKPEGDTPCNTEKDEKDFFFCKTCDSTSSANCANVKALDSIVNQVCTKGVTKCFTQIKDKHTYRACATKPEEECPKDQKCTTCTSRGCNKDIFPSDRRKCYQCQSGGTNCGNPTADMSFVCQLYEEQDACYEFGTSESTMARGCKSDSTDYGKCSAEKQKCKECSTNDCNNDKFKITPSVKCVQCKTDDADCSKGFTAEKATACTTEVEYWEKQGCYTNRIESGKVARGCAKDFDCSAASATCTLCSDSACNIAEKNELSCYKCRSDDNKKCAEPLTKAEEYKSEKCRNAILSDADLKCFIERWNGIVMRSCLVDADAKTRKNCENDKYKACEICSGDNCNFGKAPNSAYSIALAGGLLAVSSLMLRFM